MRRGEIFILLCVGLALVALVWHLTDRIERLAACAQFGTVDACCQSGDCKAR
jgi:hypothetical protein